MGIVILKFMCSMLMGSTTEIHEKCFADGCMCIHQKQVLKFFKFLMNPLGAKVEPE
jgi:hypothetical protein